jgi:signal transduction histidine kinase
MDIADSFHSDMIEYFRLNKEHKVWSGIVDTKGKKYLFRISSIIMEKDCLRCHGNPADAPKELIERYGNRSGFGRRVGDVAGINSVSIPLDVAFAHVKEVALHTFIFGIFTLGFLFFALFGTFRHLVTSPLNNLSHIFRSIAKGTVPLGKDIPSNRSDEIGDLTESFNILTRHLLDAQVRLKKAAEREKQIMETEKLATLGQLSAGVAHEINNPLGGIRLCFNNLMETEMDTNTKKHHIEVINSGLERIQNIVRQLLDFSKDSPLNIAPSSINNIIEETLKLSEYIIVRKDIELIKELSPDMPDLMVDSNKLEQVFLNLIINAVQSMDGGGVLTIRTWSDGSACNVSVIDTGKGIPSEVISRIFDPFFSTKGVGEGTGLGLTVSKAIVEQHKGKIEVSTSEKGSIFTVRIPITT